MYVKFMKSAPYLPRDNGPGGVLLVSSLKEPKRDEDQTSGFSATCSSVSMLALGFFFLPRQRRDFNFGDFARANKGQKQRLIFGHVDAGRGANASVSRKKMMDTDWVNKSRKE